MDTKTYSDGGSAKKFRDYAAECHRMAAQSSSEKDRMVLMEIAQAWTVCAEEVERKTRRCKFWRERIAPDSVIDSSRQAAIGANCGTFRLAVE